MDKDIVHGAKWWMKIFHQDQTYSSNILRVKNSPMFDRSEPWLYSLERTFKSVQHPVNFIMISYTLYVVAQFSRKRLANLCFINKIIAKDFIRLTEMRKSL